MKDELATYEVDEYAVDGCICVGWSRGPSAQDEGNTYVHVGRPWTDWRLRRARRRWQRRCDRWNAREAAAIAKVNERRSTEEKR